jgi:hypothetical protein
MMSSRPDWGCCAALPDRTDQGCPAIEVAVSSFVFVVPRRVVARLRCMHGSNIAFSGAAVAKTVPCRTQDWLAECRRRASDGPFSLEKAGPLRFALKTLFSSLTRSHSSWTGDVRATTHHHLCCCWITPPERGCILLPPVLRPPSAARMCDDEASFRLAGA